MSSDSVPSGAWGGEFGSICTALSLRPEYRREKRAVERRPHSDGSPLGRNVPDLRFEHRIRPIAGLAVHVQQLAGHVAVQARQPRRDVAASLEVEIPNQLENHV